MTNNLLDPTLRRKDLRWSVWIALAITILGLIAFVLRGRSILAGLIALLLDFPGLIIGVIAAAILPPHRLEGLDLEEVAWIIFPSNVILWFAFLHSLRRALRK